MRDKAFLTARLGADPKSHVPWVCPVLSYPTGGRTVLLGGQDRDPPSSDTYSGAVLGNAPGELKKPFFSKPNTKVTFMGLKIELSYDRGEGAMTLALEKAVMSSYGRRQKRNTWARNGPDRSPKLVINEPLNSGMWI